MENLSDYFPADDAYWQGSPNDLLKAARVCAEQGSFGSCEEYLERLRATVKDEARWMECIGALYHQIGNLKLAEECFRRAVQYDTWSAEKRARLGHVLLDIARKYRDSDLWTLRDAEYYITSSIQLNPDSARSYNLLGSVKQALSEYDEAADFYKKAIALEPNEWIWQSNYACVFYAKRDYKTCFDELTHLLERFDNATIRYSLGTCLHRMGRGEEAIPHLEKSLVGFPNSSKVRALIQTIQAKIEDGGEDKF